MAQPRPANLNLLDLGRVPYVSYGAKYIDLVSLEPATASHLKFLHGAPFFAKIAS